MQQSVPKHREYIWHVTTEHFRSFNGAVPDKEVEEIVKKLADIDQKVLNDYQGVETYKQVEVIWLLVRS